MNDWNNLYKKAFSHIYIEDDAYNYPMTQEILERFPNAEQISINHYKDVFCRGHQSFINQKKSPSLILAVKKNQRIYQGAKVCQSFANSYFYYTSIMMNCPFDCEYCYLQGMYSSGNIVLFVNQEDFMKDVEKLLCQHKVYLCISYDTDVMAMESITGLVKKWSDFTLAHPNLTIEIRTKSGTKNLFDQIPFCDRVIYAWTLSPEEINQNYEHYTATLEARLSSASYAQKKGYAVRVCFDPMIYIKDYQKKYMRLFEQTFSSLDNKKILDCSLGVFRISADYLKQMRKQRSSVITEYPYVTEKGVASYDKRKRQEMMQFAKKGIQKWLSEDKIFIWEEE